MSLHGPLRNKMATLRVIPSGLDYDPSADPVLGQTMLPIVSLTESGIHVSRAFFKAIHLKSITIGSIVRVGRNDSEHYYAKVSERDTISLGNCCGFYSRGDVYHTSDLSCKGSICFTSY